MAMRAYPGSAEIREQIRRLREEVARWRDLIKTAEARITQLGDRTPQPDKPPQAKHEPPQ